MTNNVRRWVSIATLAAVTVLGVLGLLTHKAYAQSTGELRLQGPGVPISLVATPGSVASTDVSIRNIGNQAETLKVGLQKFGQDANGNPTLADRGADDAYFDWATLAPNQLTLAPNEQQTVRMTINVPKEAAFGYYYAVTFQRAADPKNPTGQSLKGALATLVLLNVDVPGAKRELTVTDFSPSQGIFEFLPASFNVKIKNTGNVPAIPHGDVTIDQGNNELARLALNPAGGYVLPGVTRTYTVTWNDGFPHTINKTQDGKAVIDTNGQTETQFDVNWNDVNKFRIGQYTANLIMVYDNGKRDVAVQQAATFMVLPWKILLAVLVVVGLLIWAIVNDIIKFEHFLFRRGKGKSASASTSRTQLPRFKAPAAATKKPAVKKKPVAKKPAAKKPATRKRK